MKILDLCKVDSRAKQIGLLGNTIQADPLLRDKFLEPPFSVLDARAGTWQTRKRLWREKGIKSEIGRKETLTYNGPAVDFDFYRVKEGKRKVSGSQGTSIFDPVLTELMYRWFCPENGRILDPFAGGSVRGIVANYLGYKYSGIELRQEQVDANRDNALDVLPVNNQPVWYCGDSDAILDDHFLQTYDFLFSCPPYMDLEIYSEDPCDLSNMNDELFVNKYQSIIKKSCSKLSTEALACFVVGDVRCKKTGFYKDFLGITKQCFMSAGFRLYNEMILLNQVASASMRCAKTMTASKKVTKIHQNVLVFKR